MDRANESQNYLDPNGEKLNGFHVFNYSDGAKYEGDWKDGIRVGKGIMVFPNGTKYQGEWKDDKRNGKGIYIWPDGERYEGEFKDDKRDGLGLANFPNGDRYVGDYKDDIKNGQGKYVWQDGDTYEGEWKDDSWNGKGILTFLNGYRYEGEWKGGERNGQGVGINPDGSKYEGKWKDDDFVQGIGTKPDGDIYEGDWKHGNPNGRGKRTYLNLDGTIYEGEWKDGNLDGPGRLISLYGDKFEGEWKNGKKNGLGLYVFPDGEKYEGEWIDDHHVGHGIVNYHNGDRFEGEFRDSKRNGIGIYIWSDGSKYEDKFINDERTGRAVYTDSFGKKQKQYFEEGQQTDHNLLIEIRGSNPCSYSVKSKMDAILLCVKPLRKSNFCSVQINGISFDNLNEIIEYTFTNLISQSGYIMVRMEVPDLRRNWNLNKLSSMIRKFILKDSVEFIAQCFNNNSASVTLIPEILTVLIGITMQKRNELLNKVRFISMPDKLEKLGLGSRNVDTGSWNYYGVPFSREDCLSQELFEDISIDKIGILFPWAYAPLIKSKSNISGTEIGEFMELSTDSFEGKVEYGIDFAKYVYSDKNQFDPYTKYVIKCEEKFSNIRDPFYLRRIVTDSAILFSNLTYKYYPPNSIEPLLIRDPKEPFFISKATNREYESVVAIQVKPYWKDKIDIEYIYLKMRKQEFAEQFSYFLQDDNYCITLISATILKAKIGELPPIEVQREIVQKEKEEFFIDLKERLRYNEKAFGINKGDISHSIGSPLRSIKSLTGYLYEYFESENSTIPIDTIIKQSKETYSIRIALDKIYDEVIKGENWIKGIGLDLNKPIEKRNINSLIIYQLEKSNHGGYKFLVRNNVSGLENFFVDVNDNFELILENLLSNANRHAFKERSEKNIVEFSSSIVSLNNRNYLNISISNNGLPMDVSLNDYISYGIKGKNSGNSGIGGSNIYDIVKSYQGFLGLKKSYAGFSVTFDILLPIAGEYLPNKIIKEYEPDEIE